MYCIASKVSDIGWSGNINSVHWLLFAFHGSQRTETRAKIFSLSDSISICSSCELQLAVTFFRDDNHRQQCYPVSLWGFFFLSRSLSPFTIHIRFTLKHNKYMQWIVEWKKWKKYTWTEGWWEKKELYENYNGDIPQTMTTKSKLCPSEKNERNEPPSPSPHSFYSVRYTECRMQSIASRNFYIYEQIFFLLLLCLFNSFCFKSFSLVAGSAFFLQQQQHQ